MKTVICLASIIVLALGTTDQTVFLTEMNKLGLINLPQNVHLVKMTPVTAPDLFNGDFVFTLSKGGINCDITFHQEIHVEHHFLAPTMFVPTSSVVNDGCGIATQTTSVVGTIILANIM